MQLWTETPSALRVLNALRPTDLYVRLYKPLIGPDCLILSGEAVETLSEIREQHAETLNGCTFNEAHSKGRDAAGEWLDVLARQPEVQDVLAEQFGDPNLLRGWGAEIAQDMWRAAFPVREDRRAA